MSFSPNKVVVAGVGMTKFVKPRESRMYDELGSDAIRMALADAGMSYDQIQQAYVGWVYGDSTAGQRTLYKVGKTGIPIINVNNNCSTGSSAIFLARQAVESGIVDCAIAVGFEQMAPGALGAVFDDRCPPTCGGGAAILCSENFARTHGLRTDVVIVGQALATDKPSAFSGSLIQAVGAGMTADAAKMVYEQAGFGPEDLDVVELHDCFTTNEVITYEGLGLCAEGEAEKFIWDGDNTYGGRVVTNPSGGLLSKGHPLGATGLARCFELVSQLRGECGKRQVEDAKLALAHNLGLGGACVVTAYQKN